MKPLTVRIRAMHAKYPKWKPAAIAATIGCDARYVSGVLTRKAPRNYRDLHDYNFMYRVEQLERAVFGELIIKEFP